MKKILLFFFLSTISIANAQISTLEPAKGGVKITVKVNELIQESVVYDLKIYLKKSPDVEQYVSTNPKDSTVIFYAKYSDPDKYIEYFNRYFTYYRMYQNGTVVYDKFKKEVK